MSDIFRNLYNLDPVLHQLVRSRLKLLTAERGEAVTMNDLTSEQCVEILEQYICSLYREYRTLRTMTIENMHQVSRKETVTDRKN